MQSRFSAKLLLIISAFISAGCAASGHTDTFTPPSDFDARNYINPQDHGYDLMGPHQNTPEFADTFFVPIKFDARRSQQKINYPSTALRNGIRGKVLLDIYIDSTGMLQNIEVIQSPHPLLSESSKQAAEQTNYEPATLNDKPVNSFIRVPFLFQMR